MIFRRKREPILTPEQKIEAAQSKVNSAFIMFQQASDALTEANEELHGAVVESDNTIQSLKAKLDKEEYTKQAAQDEITANNKLAEKLSDFIKG